MGDMGEIFNAMREHSKEKRHQREEYFIGRFKSIDAEQKSDGVWQYKDWFLYPTKGFAMNKYNPKHKKNLDKFINEAIAELVPIREIKIINPIKPN